MFWQWLTLNKTYFSGKLFFHEVSLLTLSQSFFALSGSTAFCVSWLGSCCKTTMKLLSQVLSLFYTSLFGFGLQFKTEQMCWDVVGAVDGG